MIRVASQLTFCSPERILKRTVVERNALNVITRIFSIDENPVESAQTLFFDGIISSEIVSLKQNIPDEKLVDLVQNYNYFDFSNEIEIYDILPINKPLVLDFGTNLLEEINFKITKLAAKFSNFPIFDLIAACVYFPQYLLGNQTELQLNRQTDLLLWENVDLPNKGLTPAVRIRKI
jgi:hypothetical protein